MEVVHRKIERSFLIYFFVGSFWTLAPIWIIFLKANGLSLPEIASIDIAFWGIIFLTEIPTGIVADKFGRKISVVLSFMVQAVAIAVFALGSSYIEYMISYAIWGLGITLKSGADNAWLYDELKMIGSESEFHKILGRATAVSGLGVAIAGFIGGYLADIFNLRLAILATVFTMLFTALYVLVMKEHRVPSDKSTGRRTRNALSQITKPFVLIAASVSMIFSGIVMALIFWIQSYFDDIGLKTTEVGFILGIGIVISSAGSLLSRTASKRMGKYTLLILYGLVSVVFLLMSISYYPLSALLYFIVRFFESMATPYITTEINHHLESDSRATAMSILSATITIVLLLSELGTSFLIEAFGYSLYFVVSGLSVIAILPLTVILARNIKT